MEGMPVDVSASAGLQLAKHHWELVQMCTMCTQSPIWTSHTSIPSMGFGVVAARLTCA